MKRVRDQIGMCGRWGSWAAVGLTRDVRPVGVDAWRGAWDRIARRDRWGSRTWRGAIPARWAGIPRASPGSVQACGPRGRGRRQVEPKGGEETRTCGLLRGRGAMEGSMKFVRSWSISSNSVRGRLDTPTCRPISPASMFIWCGPRPAAPRSSPPRSKPSFTDKSSMRCKLADATSWRWGASRSTFISWSGCTLRVRSRSWWR